MKIYLKFTFEMKSKMILESKSGTLIQKILMNVMGHHTTDDNKKAFKNKKNLLQTLQKREKKVLRKIKFTKDN